jgi:hypothetical protein
MNIWIDKERKGESANGWMRGWMDDRVYGIDG